MRKIVFIFTFGLDVLAAQNYQINAKWNLLGSTEKQQNLQIQYPNAQIIWKYDSINAKWLALSPDESLSVAIDEKGFEQFNDIQSGEGFWLYNKEVQSTIVKGNPPLDSFVKLSKGWNLISSKSYSSLKSTSLLNHKCHK